MLSNTTRTRGLHAAVRFAPAAIFDKQHRQQFAMKSNEGFDWRRQEFTDAAWQFQTPQAEGDPRSHLKLSLQPDFFHFEDVFPTGSFDVFCDNLRLALNALVEVFNPRLILATGAVIRLTAQADGGDARVFLGNRCLRLEDRLGPLGRPVHALGMKLLLPPVMGKDQPNWQAEVKIESLIEDAAQLFLEVDARWAQPVSWDIDTIISRFKIAHEFTGTKVIEFLSQYGQQ